MNAVIWLIGIVVLLVIEAMTLGLTTIWFAGGALAAFIVCLLGAAIWLQLALFVAVSLLLLIFTRPLACRYMKKSAVKTNVEGLIGKTARVTETICNETGTGEAVLEGKVWMARSALGRVIEKDSIVEVAAVEGVKLIVKQTEETPLMKHE